MAGDHVGSWRVEPEHGFTEAAGVPRASDGAGPGGGRSDAAEFSRAPCAITPTASGSRVRLSVFEENRRQPRCTGTHPEWMRPHLGRYSIRPLSCSERILEAPGSGKTPRALSAKSARLAPAPRIVRPPPPTPISYAGLAACDAAEGSGTSDLLEPRSPAYGSTLLLESGSINPVFHLGNTIYLTET